MTTGGEGGMVTTNDEALWRAMWAYKDHGKSWAAVYERQHPPGFRWLHEGFGTNLYNYLVDTGRSGLLLTFGLVVVLFSLISHGTRRSGRHEGQIKADQAARERA